MKLLIAAALLLSAQDGKVELKWKFEKGREFAYRQTQKQTMEIFGTAMEQENGQTQVWTVKDVAADGTATIETKVVGVSAKASGAMEFEYDSEKDKELPENPQVRMMAKMVGKTFTLKMTPHGKVLEMKGADAVIDEMLKELGEEAGPAKEMLKQMLSDDSMKSGMQQLTPMLPTKPVGKGDSWKDEFTLKFPMVGGMKIAVSSTVKDFQDGAARLDQDWTIEHKGAGEDDKDNPLAGLIKITAAKGKADLLFSPEKGCFLSQKMTMDMTIEANGQAMPMKLQSEMKLVDKPKKNF